MNLRKLSAFLKLSPLVKAKLSARYIDFEGQLNLPECQKNTEEQWATFNLGKLSEVINIFCNLYQISCENALDYP